MKKILYALILMAFCTACFLPNTWAQPTLTTTNATICAGSSINLNSLITTNATSISWSEKPLAVKISSGYNHTLILLSNGTVVALGNNNQGQCNVPVFNSTPIDIGTGPYTSFAILSDGTAVGWGANANGESTVPNFQAAPIAISGGYYHSIALLSNGTIVGWGDNSSGETNTKNFSPTPIAISAGLGHSLALQSNGSVLGWGYNGWGELNIPNTPGTSAISISANYYHSLVLLSDGTLEFLGYDPYGGQANSQSNVPTFSSLPISISSGLTQGLALFANGTVQAWGRNAYTPSFNSTAIAISAGADNNMVLFSDGSVASWPSASQSYDPLNLNNTIVTPTVGTKTYYVVVKDNSGNKKTGSVTITTVANAISPPPAVSDITYCQNASPNPLSVTGTNVLWYTSATGGTGSSTRPTPSTATVGVTSYFVTQNTTGCESARNEIKVTVNPQPTISISANPSTVCSGGTSQLTASVSGVTTDYTTSWNNGLGNGVIKTTPALTTSTTYSATVTTTAGCSATSNNQTVTVNEIPTAPYAGTGTFCGCGNVVAKAHHSATDFSSTRIYEWYDNPNHTGNPLPSSFESNNIISIFQSSTSRTVYVFERIGDCYSPPTTVNLTILPLPSTPNISSQNIIACGSATATASISNTTNHIEWWTSANQTLGTKVGEGTSYTANSTQTVFVFEVADNTCNGAEMFHCYGVPMQINFTVNPQPSISIAANPSAICSGQTSQLTATIGGVATNYTITWNNGLGDGVIKTTPSLTTSTTYSATVTTTAGCSATSNDQTVKVNTPPSAPVVTDVNYCQSATAIPLNVVGTNVLWYTSATGGTGNSTPPIPLTATVGTVSYFVSQSTNGCESTRAEIKVKVNPLPSFSLNYPPILCNGQKTNLTITPTNGSINQFLFSIDNGSTLIPTNIFLNIGANTYQIAVSNTATGCISRQSQTITQPTALTASVTKTLSSCGGLNGSITITASGGTPPYQYSLNGSALQTSNIFSNLAAGTYNAVVTDANGCSVSNNGNVIANSTAMVLTITSSTNVLCFGAATGKIIVAATGGTGTKQYSKDGGTTWQTSATFSSLSGGDYNLVTRDANACLSNTLAVNLTEPSAALSFATVKTNETCKPSNDGTITITASGGTGLDSFSINSGAKYFVSNVFTGLTAGNYNVRVKDANGCVAATQVVNLTQPNTINFSTTRTSTSCNGGTDGKITVTNITGGAGTPYQFSLNGSVFQTSNIFTDLSAGVYDITVKDANECFLKKTGITATSPSALVLSVANSTNVACFGAATGKIVVSTTGGTGAKQYSKDGGTTWRTSAIFSGLSGGIYNMVSKDEKGCLSDTTPITLTEPASALSFTTAKTNETCSPSNDGTITINATGGTGTYSFSINNGGTYTATNIFTSLSAGNYYVRVKDANGCLAATQVVNLTQPIAINFSTSATNIVCYGGSDGIITVNTPTGRNGAPYQYSLNNGAFQTSNIFSNLTAGTYSVVIKDAIGCLSVPKSVTLTQGSALSFTFIKQDISCSSTTSGIIAITSVGGGAPNFKFSKDSGTNFQTSNIFLSLKVASYPIQVKDSKNCLSAIQNINIISTCAPVSPLRQQATEPTQYMPTVITNIYPNPTNETLSLTVNSIKENVQEFQFFDAYGRLIHSEKRNLIRGEQQLDFDVSQFAQGIFQIVTPNSNSIVAKNYFIKL